MLNVARARNAIRAQKSVGSNAVRYLSQDPKDEGLFSKIAKIFTFSPDKGINESGDISAGPRKDEAVVLEYNRDPIVPPVGAGTKENPIEVPSRFDSRVVGFEDPETHAVYWFNLDRPKIHYLPQLDKYFVLTKADDYARIVYSCI